jgi:hypothetical protein
VVGHRTLLSDGQSGRRKSTRDYGEDAYFRNLIAAYKAVIQRSRKDAAVNSFMHINSAAPTVTASLI